MRILAYEMKEQKATETVSRKIFLVMNELSRVLQQSFTFFVKKSLLVS